MQKTINEKKDYFSPDEAAEKLGVAKSTVYSLCHRKGFPAVRISPRRIVIPAEALSEWMKEQAYMR